MINYAIKELTRRKRRTLSNIIGYILTVVILVMIINILKETDKEQSSILESTGTHFIAYLPLCDGEECKNTLIFPEEEGFYANNGQVKVIGNTFAEVANSFDSILNATPFLLYKINSSGMDIFIGGIPTEGGASLENNACSASDIISGRFLNREDRYNVILEESFAVTNNYKTGDTITIEQYSYTVVGIVSPGIRPAKADIYMNFPIAEELINSRLMTPLLNESNIILVESKNAFEHKQAMADIKSLLGSESIISTYGCYIPAASALGISRSTLLIISLIIYLFMLVLILKSQYSVIIERRFEIGVLVAIGWKKSQVVQQLLLESILQAVIGWSVAIVVALILQQVYLPSIFISLGVALSGGVIGGVIPGLSAVRKNPAFCLRNL